MNKLKFALIISLFIVLPKLTYANCAKEEIDYFKKVADNYKITYKYNKNTRDYAVNFYNPEPNKYEYKVYASKESFANYNYISDNETSYSNVVPDEYYIEIIGITDTCNDIMKTITINITTKNNYSNDPLCEGIEEFVLCQPNYDKDIDYETFTSRVNTYKKTKETKKTNEPINEEKNSKIINKILEIIKGDTFQIAIIIALAILLVIVFILSAKSARKSRRLE